MPPPPAFAPIKIIGKDPVATGPVIKACCDRLPDNRSVAIGDGQIGHRFTGIVTQGREKHGQLPAGFHFPAPGW